MNGWDHDSNLAAHMAGQRKGEVLAEHKAMQSTHPTIGGPTELGSFRRWWSDHPMLSVVAMFVAPVMALLLFMALY